MIAIIKPINSLLGVLEYNENKSNKEIKGEDIMSGELINLNNIYKGDVNTIYKTLNYRNAINTRVKNPNIQFQISLHPNDKVDNNKMNHIAQDYLKEMGFIDQPFVVYRHYDRSHPHVHIITTQINKDGKKIKDNFQRYNSNRIRKKLEEKYNLTKADKSVSLSKIEDIHIATKKYFDKGEGGLTNIITNSVLTALSSSPRSIPEFDYLLELNNVKKVVNKKNEFSYVLFNPDKKEEQIRIAIPGSSLYEKLSTKYVEEKIEHNKDQKNKLQRSVMGRVYGILNSLEKSDRKYMLSEFDILLKRKGILLTIKRRSSGDLKGKINGYSFTDIKSNIKYNASEFKIKLKYMENLIEDDKYDLTKPVVENTNKQSLDNNYIHKLLTDTTYSSDEYQEDLNKHKKKKRKKGGLER